MISFSMFLNEGSFDNKRSSQRNANNFCSLLTLAGASQFLQYVGNIHLQLPNYKLSDEVNNLCRNKSQVFIKQIQAM